MQYLPGHEPRLRVRRRDWTDPKVIARWKRLCLREAWYRRYRKAFEARWLGVA